MIFITKIHNESCDHSFFTEIIELQFFLQRKQHFAPCIWVKNLQHLLSNEFEVKKYKHKGRRKSLSKKDKKEKVLKELTNFSEFPGFISFVQVVNVMTFSS